MSQRVWPDVTYRYNLLFLHNVSAPVSVVPGHDGTVPEEYLLGLETTAGTGTRQLCQSRVQTEAPPIQLLDGFGSGLHSLQKLPEGLFPGRRTHTGVNRDILEAGRRRRNERGEGEGGGRGGRERKEREADREGEVGGVSRDGLGGVREAEMP